MNDVTLVDILDRVIDRGVVVAGDVTLSVANVDLVYLDLRVLLAAVQRLPDLMPPAVAARSERTTDQPGAAHVDL
jgi:gas vesicle structural protein